jgi:hypothetical protein
MADGQLAMFGLQDSSSNSIISITILFLFLVVYLLVVA